MPAKRLAKRLCSLSLESQNQEIANLAATAPHGNIRDVFALAAHLAGEAIEGATALQRERATGDFAPTLEFWHRLRDYAGTAALNCGGANQSLAEALVTLRFLQKAAGEVPHAR
jgi:hypothetical protein